MKPGDLEYQALVEKKRAEIRGNIESKVMSPEETAAEIAQIADGAVSSFEGEIPLIIETKVVSRAEMEKLYPPKKKRGRPVGSRNKVKSPKGS